MTEELGAVAREHHRLVDAAPERRVAEDLSVEVAVRVVWSVVKAADDAGGTLIRPESGKVTL